MVAFKKSLEREVLQVDFAVNVNIVSAIGRSFNSVRGMCEGECVRGNIFWKNSQRKVQIKESTT